MSYNFKGTYHHSIDSKNRINIPSKYRKSFIENSENDLVINYEFDQCITIYSKTIFDKTTEAYRAKLTNVNPKHRLFLKLRTIHADDCRFDNQGRITLTQILKEKANIDKDATIIGAGDRIEIWNPEVLKHHLEDNILTDDDFAIIEADLKQ